MDILTIEVGSTITKANAFRRLAEGRLEPFAQGFAATTVEEGDVAIGVENAMRDLETLSQRTLVDPEIYINSSAAGGLRMTVHGLTYNMTARAAQEAALGAGAIIKQVTAGALEESELDEIRAIQPNIILLAGGVDYGEKKTVLENAEKIASLGLKTPVIYAGNSVIRAQIRGIFASSGAQVLLADNVFPDVDVLNIEPVRYLIYEVFNQHIIHAPGMARLSELTHTPILPTPGAVLRATELFAEVLGDVLVIDVGGATTDVHSVTEGSPEWTSKLVDPEPYAKRTVEGDLGVFINARNILSLSADPEWNDRLEDLRALPETEREINLTHYLCERAVETAIRRHAGVIIDQYTPVGKKQVVKGKDLTAVRWVVGTGGALTRIPGGADILRGICKGPGKYLLPKPEARILIDRDYRFSALGTLAAAYPDEVRKTMLHWVENMSGPLEA
jgi:uncharacterized protein (TIGR01319 family)